MTWSSLAVADVEMQLEHPVSSFVRKTKLPKVEKYFRKHLKGKYNSSIT